MPHSDSPPGSMPQGPPSSSLATATFTQPTNPGANTGGQGVGSLFNLSHATLPGFPTPAPLNSLAQPGLHNYAPPTRLPAMQTLHGVLQAGNSATVDQRRAASVDRMRLGAAERGADLVLRQGFSSIITFRVIVLPASRDRFRQQFGPHGASLRMDQQELHRLFDRLQATGLAFSVEVPSDS